MERIEVQIMAYRVPEVEGKLQTLQKRMEKKGLAGMVEYTVGPVEMRVVREGKDGEDDVVEAFRTVICHFDPPKLNGWEFLARIEHFNLGDEGYANMIYARPGYAEGAHKQFGDAAPDCDHCGYKRIRKDTFIVQHEEKGDRMQVGSTCLKDFLGIDPTAMLEAAQYLREIYELKDGEGFGGFYGGGEYGHNLWQTLCHAATSTLKRGYVSVKIAEETGRARTSDDVYGRMYPVDKKGNRLPPEDTTQEGRELAFGTFWYLQELAKRETLDNDYLANLATVYRIGYIPNKAFGIAVSAVACYLRERDRALDIERKKVDAKHLKFLGEVGKRMRFENVTVGKVIPMEGDYGMTYITLMRDQDGNGIVWFGSAQKFDVECTYSFDAMVKKHNERKGFPQTVVNRPTKVQELTE